MCGRFTLRTPLTVLAQQFLFELGDVPATTQVSPRYNIAPTQTVAAIKRSSSTGRRELALFHWGLIPSWAKDAKIAAKMINARRETLAEKPAFRTALARRRCLVLADGFYEWRREGKHKLPYCFQLADERPFAFAGLWERWSGSGDIKQDAIESCTIITTAANEVCSPFHERMPVILAPEHYDLWLDPATTECQRLLSSDVSLPMKVTGPLPRVGEPCERSSGFRESLELPFSDA